MGTYAYFSGGTIISLVYLMADGATEEVAVIGSEGMASTAVFMGGETTPSEMVVQYAGVAYRLKADALMREFARGGAFQRTMLHFTQALNHQTSQTAVCNRHHAMIAQVCHWLLLCADRMPGNQVDMTHELMAAMLGVRREGVTRALGALVEAGVVQNHRGYITLLDRPAIEERVCECYGVVEVAYKRLLSSALPSPRITR